jgi:hypothetical protein
MRIEQIEAIDALTPEQAELLRELLQDSPHLDQSALRLYRVRTGAGPLHSMVAPASPDLDIGMTVICVGWTKGIQSASSGSPDTHEVHLVAKLVADALTGKHAEDQWTLLNTGAGERAHRCRVGSLSPPGRSVRRLSARPQQWLCP